jgi:hypothetical protein
MAVSCYIFDVQHFLPLEHVDLSCVIIFLVEHTKILAQPVTLDLGVKGSSRRVTQTPLMTAVWHAALRNTSYTFSKPRSLARRIQRSLVCPKTLVHYWGERSRLMLAAKSKHEARKMCKCSWRPRLHILFCLKTLITLHWYISQPSVPSSSHTYTRYSSVTIKGSQRRQQLFSWILQKN